MHPITRTIFEMEVKQLFAHPRIFHFIPLLVAGVVLAAWVYPVAPPFVPVMLVVFTGLELQFNNMFFRTPAELDSLSMFPDPWRRVVVAKNLAAVFLAAAGSIVMSAIVMYFSPGRITLREVAGGAVYFLTVIFPLMQIGNSSSLRNPRSQSGLRISDFIEALWMVITLGVVSVPYVLLGGMPLPCLVYAAVTAVIWYKRSIPRTAGMLMSENQPEPS